MTSVERAIKRVADIFVAATALVIAAPVLAVTAVAIRLDSAGPVFFRQDRLGRDGKIFRIVKFRTMRKGAGVSIDPAGNVVNTAMDSRHTRIGRWLRRTSIDELPQLVNVLLGDMSIIGPRPDLPDALAYYAADERDKLSVRPGMTGLAQALGRNRLSAHEKWALDAKYAREASLAMDSRILGLTLGAVFARRGIYADDTAARSADDARNGGHS